MSLSSCVPFAWSPGSHQSAFCLCGFTCSRYFLNMESRNYRIFLSGFFPLAQYFLRFIHVVACIRTLCLMPEKYSIKCSCHIFFTRSFADGYLGSFRHLAIAPPVSTCLCPHLSEYLPSAPLSISVRGELLGYFYMYVFKELSHFSTAAKPFYIFTHYVQGSSFSASWPKFVSLHLGYNHPGGYEDLES